jgi:hypothetical protein
MVDGGTVQSGVEREREVQTMMEETMVEKMAVEEMVVEEMMVVEMTGVVWRWLAEGGSRRRTRGRGTVQQERAEKR